MGAEARIPQRRGAGERQAGAGAGLVVIVAARNEADRIDRTLSALRNAFPAAALLVADDASSDGTAAAAIAAGAAVIGRARSLGKGANVTAAAEVALAEAPPPSLFLLCDGDLGGSASNLSALVEALQSDRCDLAVAVFSRRRGGGFGISLGFARWAIRHLCGAETVAPISGQRALRAEVLQATLPFASGYGMEIAMTVDAIRAGFRLSEYEIDLSHRVSDRTIGGFAHRARQFVDFVRVYLQLR